MMYSLSKEHTSQASTLILVINPGSTSTKVALYSGLEEIASETIDHTNDDWAMHKRIIEQLPDRRQAVLAFLERHGVCEEHLSCVVGRGGLLRPIRSGTYLVNQAMVADLTNEVGGSHASNLGGLLARSIAGEARPAFIVDPVAVDEYRSQARLSGCPELPRRSLLHALNMRRAARRAALDLGIDLEKVKLVIAHLGSGFSISPFMEGRLVDANNSNEEGPFTVERAGTVASMRIVELVRTFENAKDLKTLLTSKSGMFSYLGTKDARKVELMFNFGDEVAGAVVKAMAYQVSKEIWAMAMTLSGRPDAVVLTGGLVRFKPLTEIIQTLCRNIAPFLAYPGEDEMRALAEGAMRVLMGQEQYREYPDKGGTCCEQQV